MPEGGGTEWRQQLEKQIEELQKDTKILLRARVLQGAQLTDHDAALTRLENLMSRWEERQARSEERQDRLDERIDNLVSAIGELVRRGA